MPTVKFGEKEFEVDEYGFLLNYYEYCDEWVDYVKTQEEIKEITDEHWVILKVIQDYYERNGIAPLVRVLSKLTKLKLKAIYENFPSGPGKGACKMAGLPNFKGCT